MSRRLKQEADVLIVGAGVGGLAVGALLAHGGRRVLVIERNSFLGGRCTSYEKEGFVIDAFAHMIGRCEKGPFGEVMKRLKRPDALRWWHATPENKPIFLIDNQPYPYPDASFSSREELAQVYRTFGLGDEDVAVALKIKATIQEMDYEATFALDDIPYRNWLEQFTTNRALLALERQKALIFSVVTLKEASAGELIRMTQNCERDANIGYPKGGCIRIPQALAEAITDHGGEVRTSTPVERILVEKGRVRGVKLADGRELNAPVVISNAGIKETAFRLVGEEFLPADYVERVRALTTGRLVEQTPMGLIYLKLALNQPVIKAPLIFLNVKQGALEGSREMMQALIEDKPPQGYQGINTFIPVTSNMDPNLAPPGKQLVNFYGLAPIHSQNWQPWIAYHLGFLFRLYPELEKHLMWYDFSTSHRIAQFSGRFHPDIIGIAQSVGQTGKNRPSPLTPVEGLYLVGSDVGRDNIGTELAAESGLRVAELLS